MDYVISTLALALSGYAAYAAFSASRKPKEEPKKEAEVLLGKFDDLLYEGFVTDFLKAVAADTKFWKGFLQYCSQRHIDALADMQGAGDTRSIFIYQGQSQAWLRLHSHVRSVIDSVEAERERAMKAAVEK